jgi:uncharacterized protein (TIGR03435 family)
MIRTLVVCVLCLGAAAQPRPVFEVASVKPSGDLGGSFRSTAGVDADRINFVNVTLRTCIQRAFSLKSYQIAGPDWLNQERFVILAKASVPAPEEKILEMLQTLLVDRFKLAFHRETRETAVYALVVAKNGPRLKDAKDESVSQISGGVEAVFEGVPMGMLANVIGNSLDRPVLDETGLKGRYDFTLTWSERKRKGPAPESAAPEAPSIFTSLPAMLGLKLEARRVPMEIFVIDRVERPSEN